MYRIVCVWLNAIAHLVFSGFEFPACIHVFLEVCHVFSFNPKLIGNGVLYTHTNSQTVLNSTPIRVIAIKERICVFPSGVRRNILSDQTADTLRNTDKRWL